MKIDITGNPGTGNTFTEINIGYVENYNPNLTTLNINHYDGKQQQHAPKQNGEDELQKQELKAEIMSYVKQLSDYVCDGWKNRYERLWETILSHPKVSKKVYSPGKQHATFNKYLVANIICMMCKKSIITEKNMSALTIALEGTTDHAVRGKLAFEPDDADVKKAVLDVFEKFPE